MIGYRLVVLMMVVVARRSLVKVLVWCGMEI